MRVPVVHNSHSFYIVSILVLEVLISVSIFIVLFISLYFHDYMSLGCLHALSIRYWISIAYIYIHIYILFSEVSVKGFVPFHN